MSTLRCLCKNAHGIYYTDQMERGIDAYINGICECKIETEISHKHKLYTTSEKAYDDLGNINGVRISRKGMAGATGDLKCKYDVWGIDYNRASTRDEKNEGSMGLKMRGDFACHLKNTETDMKFLVDKIDLTGFVDLGK